MHLPARAIVCALVAAPMILAFSGFAGAGPAKQKVILDTDIGSDIDDAFALALLLTEPTFEILGVTLGHGLTGKRAQVVGRMLYETGFEKIPVAVGRETPNVVGIDTALPPPAPQMLWAEGFHKVVPVATPAADFIIQMLRRYPGEVVLFTIGPVTNLGDVVRKDPDALRLAKHVYSMFGSFYIGYGRNVEGRVLRDGSDPVIDAEWNVRADVASAKLLAASGARITYAGLDVTSFVTLSEKDRLRLLMRQSPLTSALSALYALWGRETPVLYDAVAVGMAIWPDLFVARPASVRVLDGGFTVIDESQPPTSEVGLSINRDEFIARLLTRLLQQNFGRS